MNGSPDCEGKMILHPDFEKLKAEIEKLRSELEALVFERDDLLFNQCKNIEMAYMLSVGALEYKVYELECAILRLKRKAELIQAKKNRQEKPDLSEIEAILIAEFAAYQQKLNEQLAKMNDAYERSKSEVLTEEEARELKRLYRGILKALHPDLHPDLTGAQLNLFFNAVEAYKSGNLEEMLVISILLDETIVSAQEPDGFAFLTKEKERLEKLIQNMESRIQEIKSEYPYTMKSLVENPEKIKALQAELRERIEQLNELLSLYMARIEELLR